MSAYDKTHKNNGIDYSAVTPATGTNANNHPIDDSFANEMPASDSPGQTPSPRSHPDKVIPGPEAATGVDQAEEEHTKKNV